MQCEKDDDNNKSKAANLIRLDNSKTKTTTTTTGDVRRHINSALPLQCVQRAGCKVAPAPSCSFHLSPNRQGAFVVVAAAAASHAAMKVNKRLKAAEHGTDHGHHHISVLLLLLLAWDNLGLHWLDATERPLLPRPAPREWREMSRARWAPLVVPWRLPGCPSPGVLLRALVAAAGAWPL